MVLQYYTGTQNGDLVTEISLSKRFAIEGLQLYAGVSDILATSMGFQTVL